MAASRSMVPVAEPSSEPGTVLGQGIADVGELCLLALAIEPGVGIGGRNVGIVAARLAVEVTFAIATTRRRLTRTVLGAEALHRRPGRNLRSTCVPSTEKCSSDKRPPTS